MKQNRILLCVVLFLMTLNILVPVLYAQQPLSGMSEEERNQKIKDAIQKHREEKTKYQHPKVDDVLVEIEDEYKKGADDAAKRFAAGEVLKDEDGKDITKSEDAYKKGGVAAVKSKFGHDRSVMIKEGNKIWVDIYLIPEATFDRAVLERLGGEFGEITSISFGALIPIDKIRKIADEVEGIQHIYMPEVAWPSSYQSEGLSQIRFANYSAAGIKGSGVKVAVIDLGFAGLSNAITNGDLPSNVTKILCGGTSCASTTFSSETEKHGTAVAEIIYDMAKEAQLYLIKIDGTKESLKAAKNYCFNNNNQIKIINESLNWYNQNFYDGVCHNDDSAVCTAKDAYNTRNILWINSAGNEAKRHYEANYSAPPGSECHLMPDGKMPEFDLTWDDINTGKTFNAYLTWSAWPTTNQNYDLYIYKDGGIYGGSTIVQNGTKPTEKISWALNPFTAEIGTYQICVNKVSATSNHNFELFIDSTPGPSKTFNTGSYIADGSILGPADAAEVLTVGAIDYTAWTSGPPESFSSKGPTNNGLIKPDIMGQDYVTTYSYGIEGFPGTSAAAPHVVGAAALLLSKNSGQSASQLRSALINSAIPMGSGYPNNIYGYGRLNLPTVYKLNVSKGGIGDGTVTSSPSGIDCGTDCIGGFDYGTSVILTATPNDRSKFSLWSGACSGTNSPCSVTMNTDKNVTAYFDGKPVISETPASYDFGSSTFGFANTFTVTNVGLADLSISSVSLSGTNSSDFNIPFILDNCSGHSLVPYTSCSFAVELQPASAGSKSAAINISSNDPDHGTLSVPLIANIPLTYYITSTAGTGGTITPLTATVNFNGSQTFTITPNYSYHIADVKVDGVSVSGYPTSTNTAYTLTLSNTKAAHTISATFLNNFKLTISKSGIGSGTITSSTGGLSCGTKCSSAISQGTLVTLTAMPDTGSTFVGWSSGGCSGTGSCTLSVNSDTTVTAIFTAPYIVTSTISAGGEHSVALRNSGMLWDCGGNASGQLGDGTTTNRFAPVRGVGGEWVSVSTGLSHTVAIRNDGTLWAWGENTYGQLGDNTTVNRVSPVQIGMDSDWMAVSAGGYHTIALKTDGTLWAWGYNLYGQLGDASYTDRHSPAKIGAATNWSTIAAGNWHTVAIKNDGTLWTWGANWFGQLGDGTTTDRYAPGKIGYDTDWAAVSAGDSHTLALKGNKTLWAWGYNYDGELGDNTTTERHSPVRIGSDSNWSAISAGDWHNMALKTDGTMWAWGYNYDGELGNGTTNDEWSPVNISSGNPWKGVSAGSLHNIAVKNDGTLWGWGANQSGQVGDGTTTDRHSPVMIYFQTYTLATAGTGGTVSPSGPLMVSYGAIQMFTVAPDTEYHVTSVTGCGGTLSGNTYTTGAITANCTVSASFAINTYTVSFNSNGGNSVSSQAVEYNKTATAPTAPIKTGYTFAGWYSDSGLTTSFVFTTAITANITLYAKWTVNQYTVTLSAGPNGTVNLSNPQIVNYNGTLSFTVDPNTGYHIASLTGCGGTLSDNTYTTGAITANCTVSASFAINTYTLTVAKSGAGSATVTSNPAGISCGADCSEVYSYGSVITLTASADANSTFTGWSGGGCSGTGDCTVTMTADTNVTATFGCSASPVRIPGKGDYSTLQAAYDTAVEGDTILSRGITLTGNLNANRDISITIDGGYSCDYSSNLGSTALSGSMTTSSGTVNIKNFNLQ